MSINEHIEALAIHWNYYKKLININSNSCELIFNLLSTQKYCSLWLPFASKDLYLT